MDDKRIEWIRARIEAVTDGAITDEVAPVLRADAIDLLAAIDAARADVARLREALERVIEQADAVERDDTPTLDLLINAEAIARAALRGK